MNLAADHSRLPYNKDDTMTSSIDLMAIDEGIPSADAKWAARARAFVDAEVLPNVAQWHEEGLFPVALFDSLGALGVLEAVVDGNISPLAYGLVMRELERGGSPIRSCFSVQGALALNAIRRYGSPAQQERWVGPVSRFETVASFALTEPDIGSNPAAMQTTAKPLSSGGFQLDGHKRWVTNGGFAGVAVVWARCGDGVRGFLVPLDTPGVERRSIVGKWSFRASNSAELLFHGVSLPEEAALPGATSLGKALACLLDARHGIAWGVCGAAGACLEETRDYLLQRKQFNGNPLASHQLIQGKLAWMATDLAAMTLIARQLTTLKEHGAMTPAAVSLAKMHNCRKALDIARGCRDLLGANGITNDHHIGRRMVDLETVITYEGTEHIHALILGDALTGIKAFS